MLLWFVIAAGFVICVVAWHLWQGITPEEAGALFIASALVFAFQLHFIYQRATTDHYIVSGYVTSLIHRPPYDYQCGKSTCHEPERWIIEQRPRKALRDQTVTRSINDGHSTEECRGECVVSWPAPYGHMSCCADDVAAYSISVSNDKLRRTKIGDPSTVWQSYFNPVQISEEVIYDASDAIPYFGMDDYNLGHRLLLTPGPSRAVERKIEEINADYSAQNISVGLIITRDNLYFEKLRRAWHQGKANDFVVVVYAPDGKAIANTNVLGWDNYALQQNVIEAVSGVDSVNPDKLIGAIRDGLKQGPPFTVADFSRYNFLDVKIPHAYYTKIIGFQVFFFIYTLLLLNFNPNTKTKKLKWSQVGQMWQKHFTPPSWTWYLHPLTPSGMFLHGMVPFFIFQFFIAGMGGS